MRCDWNECKADASHTLNEFSRYCIRHILLYVDIMTIDVGDSATVKRIAARREPATSDFMTLMVSAS